MLLAQTQTFVAQIKTEPKDVYDNDENESDQNVIETDESLLKIKRRLSCAEKPQQREPKCSRFEEDEPVSSTRSNVNQNNYREKTVSAPRVPVSQRDPRLMRLQSGGTSSSDESVRCADPKRKAFIDRMLSPDDIIRASSSTNNRQTQFRDIKDRVFEATKLMSSEPKTFYSTVPVVPLKPGGSHQNRSPLISNNQYARFRSQSTTDNIQECVTAQRYRNIPSTLQNVFQRVGVELDEISQSMQPPQHRLLPSDTSYNENQRSIMSQTDFEHHAEPSHAVNEKEKRKNVQDKEVQTTKNSGVFSITIDDLSILTEEQRKGLEAFKRVLFY